MFKVGDEVVLLHITGSGYCKVLEVDGDKVKVDWFVSEHFPPQWYPKKLLRYATDGDREYVEYFKNLNKTTSDALNELESNKESKTFNSADELFEDLEK